MSKSKKNPTIEFTTNNGNVSSEAGPSQTKLCLTRLDALC